MPTGDVHAFNIIKAIQQYLIWFDEYTSKYNENKNSNVDEAAEKSVKFLEWQLEQLIGGKLDLIKGKENGNTMWFFNNGKLPLLRISTKNLYGIFNKWYASQLNK